MADAVNEKRNSDDRRDEKQRRKNLLMGWEFKENRDLHRRKGPRRNEEAKEADRDDAGEESEGT